MRRVGAGRLTAEFVAGATRITEMSHSAPARLFPVQAAGSERTGATGFVLGGFGGGLLGGDQVDVRMRVGPRATLVGWTQGTTKVYQSKKDLLPTVQSMEAVIGPGALLVLAPDPVMPFAQARYIQHQRFELADEASVVVVDGVNCGRASRGERWQFSSFRSTNEYYSSSSADANGQLEEAPAASAQPFLADALALEKAEGGTSNWSMDLGTSQRDACASIVAVGPRATLVGAEMRRLAAALAIRGGARVSMNREAGDDENAGGAHPHDTLPALGGSVCMGVSSGVPGGRSDVTTCRIVAELPEDITRIIARCMEPLAPELGTEILPYYSGRVHASSLASSAPAMKPATTDSAKHVGGYHAAHRVEHHTSAHVKPAERPLQEASSQGMHGKTGNATHKEALLTSAPSKAQSVALPTSVRSNLDAQQLWALLQLADPTLPINGFAHSAGLEAATHTSVFKGEASGSPQRHRWRGGRQMAVSDTAMKEYFESAASASARLYAPFAAAAYRSAMKVVTMSPGTVEFQTAARDFEKEWASFNERLAALLAPVAPAHRASTVQGSALLQIAHTWFRTTSPPSGSSAMEVLDTVRGVTIPTGVHFACMMGLVGAALRLPEDVTLDALGYASVRALISAAVRLSLMGPQRAVGFQAAAGQSWAAAFSAAAQEVDVSQAANTAPLLDAVHGIHDLLEARLFQT